MSGVGVGAAESGGYSQGFVVALTEGFRVAFRGSFPAGVVMFRRTISATIAAIIATAISTTI